MPNWCYTSYAVEGPREKLQELYGVMTRIASLPRPGLLENDFGSSWLGNLVATLGVDPRSQANFRCRGEYHNVNLNQSGSLTFDTTTAWGEADDTRRLIERKFPGVHLFYISEEFGNGYWESNDTEGKYFNARYYFDAEDCDGDYYETLPDLIKAIEKTTGLTGMQTFEDCDESLQDYREGDYSYSLYRVNFDNQDE